MKSASAFLLGAFVAAAVACAPNLFADDKKKVDSAEAKKDKPKAPEFKSSKEKASYCIGIRLGQTILRDFGRADVVDTDAFVKGMKASLANEVPFENEEIVSAVIGYRTEVIKEDAKRFLEDNAKKEGVKKTSSGVQYVVLKSGEGKQAQKDSTVVVHYTGTLVNGTKFDSSVDRNEPATFSLAGGLIQGWKDAIPLMKVGDKWRLFIPPELGYGEQGRPGIPPHAVLIFEVELIEVK